MIITKESTTQQITQQRKQGKLEHKNHFIKEVIYIFTVHHTNVTQAYYDLRNNTLRLDSTHPDTYNLVGFSRCLHLWWIPLLTPELLTPELCVTSNTMNQFPSPQG